MTIQTYGINRVCVSVTTNGKEEEKKLVLGGKKNKRN